MLGYDCELFPLPGAASASPAPAAQPAAAVAAVPAAVVVPAAEGATAPAVPTPPASTPPESTPTSSSGPSHAPAYVAFALGAAGAGVTAAFGILALKTKSTLSGECSNGMCPSSASSTVSNLTLYDDVTDIGLGVAIAGVALGAILFATEHGPSTTSATRHLQPWLGLGAGGLRGSF
jgi:hypothetical protein